MLITISGEPGSGKTTVARLIARQLGLRHVYAGDLYRSEARRRGLTLAELNRESERDHSIDRELDARMAEHARRGNAVLEGRLAAFLVTEQGIPALRVWLTAGERVRAERAAQRDGGSVEAMLEANRRRHESDARRYKEIYGWDLADTSVYDAIIATDNRTPEEVAAQVVDLALRRFGREARP